MTTDLIIRANVRIATTTTITTTHNFQHLELRSYMRNYTAKTGINHETPLEDMNRSNPQGVQTFFVMKKKKTWFSTETWRSSDTWDRGQTYSRHSSQFRTHLTAEFFTGNYRYPPIVTRTPAEHSFVQARGMVLHVDQAGTPQFSQ